MQKLVLLTFAALLGAALAGCATPTTPSNANTTTPGTTTPQDGEKAPQTLAYAARQTPGMPDANTTYSFEGPATARAGWTLVTLTNAGLEPHQLVLVKLPAGQTNAQHVADMMGNGSMENRSTNDSMMGGDGMTMGGNASANGTSNGSMMAAHADHVFVGGVASTTPPPPPGAPVNYSSTSATWVHLTPGTYVIECDIPGPAGAHAMHGMTKELTVTGDAMDAAPASNATLTLKDFSFTWGANLTAGHYGIKVVNQGESVHEAVFFHLAPGKTAADVLAFLANATGQPPILDSFGAGALTPGQTEIVDATLVPGDYGVICFMPGPDGQPHFAHGMVQTLHVG